jgi:hypothetical protein
MAAYRLDGGRLFYVEHKCASAESKTPNSRHLLKNKVHNSIYVVRMFYIGDLETRATMVSVNDFAYMTDGVSSVNEYVNCPLCGSEGHIAPDKDEKVEVRGSFNPSVVTESPFE